MSRRGFSLLEIIIATGILAASAVVLMSMFSTGERHARRAEERIIAQMLCHSKLDELLADPSKLVPVQADAFPQFPGWVYSIDVQPTSLDKLVHVRVAVTHIPGMPTGARLQLQPASEEETLALPSLTLPAEPTYTLTRWMRFEGDLSTFIGADPTGLESPDRFFQGRTPWSSE